MKYIKSEAAIRKRKHKTLIVRFNYNRRGVGCENLSETERAKKQTIPEANRMEATSKCALTWLRATIGRGKEEAQWVNW